MTKINLTARHLTEILRKFVDNQRIKRTGKKNYQKRNDAGENLHLFQAEKGDKARILIT